ncbi:MAG: hypothetical protein CMJ19_08995 [Phycisphaeraceae bacterium]|nr:hypothetical protein [Phycisphaeraceae bacterium]
MNTPNVNDPALLAPKVYIRQFPDTLKPRQFQGIPGIACTSDQTLWATWYGGGNNEGPDNYIMLANCPKDGQWSEPWLIVRHDVPNVRAFDPTLWVDPQGRLWLFWAQTEVGRKLGDSQNDGDGAPDTNSIWDGRGGVWGICCENPTQQPEVWQEPHRFCHGIMMNKPTVDEAGNWLMPASIWNLKPYDPAIDESQRGPTVTICDGKTLDAQMQATPGHVPDLVFDEHHVLTMKDGRWGMWIRTLSDQRLGAVSYSSDRGKSWSDAQLCSIPCPNSRFYVGRLKSGALLLISHHITDTVRQSDNKWPARSHLTAWVSDDEGQTWLGELLIDEREQVSYPDVDIADDGTIHVIYDYQRYKDRQILYVALTEDHIRQGNTPVTINVVNQATCPLDD